MSNFTYITPSQLLAKHPNSGHSLAELREKANQPDEVCSNCHEPAWKYAGLGMCFYCTTGESDASGDYELVPEGGQGE